MPLLFLLFILVPLGELALLLWIAQHTHWAFPLTLVVVTGVLGVILLKVQGIITATKIRTSLSQGQAPTDSLIDAGLMLLAAGLLLTPGVLTDLFGLSLIFPPTRALHRAALKSAFKSRFQIVTWPSPEDGPGDGPDDKDVIEGEVVRED